MPKIHKRRQPKSDLRILPILKYINFLLLGYLFDDDIYTALSPKEAGMLPCVTLRRVPALFPALFLLYCFISSQSEP